MNIHFGENVRRLRIERGMTQEGLAEFLGVSFQAVSKWERGETVPDLFMLPVIALFFGVTTDYLLGLDKSEQEKEIQEYIDLYSKLWQEAKYEDVLKCMKQAIKAFPSEYGLLVRYMNALIWCGSVSDARALSIKNEVEAVYDRISRHCSVDSIRMWAKKLVCKYYKRLSGIKGSGVVFEDIEKILSEMPLMQNGRDFLVCSMHPGGGEKAMLCRKTISELLYLLSCTVKELTFEKSVCPNEEKLAILEAVINAYKTLFPDEDYGKSYINVAYLLAECGALYRQLGNDERADQSFNEANKIAEVFDALPAEFVNTSVLVKDLSLTKRDIPMSQSGSLSDRITKYVNHRTPF
ncbi:MAG: helix-turn-helix transcriptional regulator [Ruminococcaceae bacterium]|nr:helix-turn-helix transcriptional regulator [Oscillospiraceae bacterium]